MENLKTIETIVSSFAVILDETLDPQGVFLFHTNDERDKNGKITQPAGWKLPGGRYEKPRDKTPRHAARNETLLEIGLKIELAKFFRDSNYGEALVENKNCIREEEEEEAFNLKVYTFFMKRVGNKRRKNAEYNEGGARGSFPLADVLLMPLANDAETNEKNPYGIHYSARRRVFITLKRAGYDFLKLIPNLPEFIDRIDWKEVGKDVYWILRDAIDEPPKVEMDEDEGEESILTQVSSVSDDYIAGWRRWAEKNREYFEDVASGKIKIPQVQ